MTRHKRTPDLSPLETCVRAWVRQAQADGMALPDAGASALTTLLRRQGFDAPPLRAAAPAVARLLAEVLTPAQAGFETGRTDR